MILQVKEALKAFGGLVAVNKVSLNIQEGDIHAIIGPNGAGKTTLFNLITKYLEPDGGSIIFQGEDITKLSPDTIVKKGIYRSFQTASIYPMLTVKESIRVAILARERRTMNFWKSANSMFNQEADEIMDGIGLTEQSDKNGGSLSQGDKKRLELAIAMAARPKVLLLDEPTGGMSIEETRATTELISELRKRANLTILFTEHDMSVVFGIANRITVLHEGKVLADGIPQEIQKNDEVQRVYLGAEVG